MGTLYIDQKNVEIQVEKNHLVFYENGNRKGTIPLSPLERIVMIGNFRLETGVLHKITKYNISCIFLSGLKLQFCAILHGRLHRNGILRLKQYQASHSPLAIWLAKDFIIKKLQKQSEFLEYIFSLELNNGFELSRSIQKIKEALADVKDQTNIDTIRGLEGSAAHIYFQALSTAFPLSLSFRGRNRRPPKDPVNSCLSLGYTLLHFEMVREVEIIGLDPTIGFFHSFEYGRESLACDLCEMFRPDIDRFVFEMFRTDVLKPKDFHIDSKAGIKACYLKKKAREKYFESYEKWASENRRLWTEEVRNLARRIQSYESSLS